MKKAIGMRIRLVFCMLPVLCALLMSPLSATAAKLLTGAVTAIGYEERGNSIYYGRQALASLPNSTALLYAYDQLALGVEASSEKIAIYNGRDSITPEELQTVIDAYRRDYTHHFWFGSTYSYEYDSKTVHNLLPSYLMTGGALETAKTAFEGSADEILSGISDSMSDFDKELYLHDALAERVVYVESANAHNAYGAIVEGRAVCEGYAEALQYLLHRVGIPSFIALGSSLNPSTGTTENHAWNYVQIDGQYYHVDLTWNDQGSELYHAYFNVTDARIREDHEILPCAYSVPSCTSEDHFYFGTRGALLESGTYSIESIALLLKNNGMRADVYVKGDPSDLTAWFEENSAEIATRIGITSGFTMGCAVLGREVKLMLEVSVCEHTTLTPITAKDPTCTEMGNDAYFVCSCGKWFEDPDAETEITGKNSVRLPALGHRYVGTENPETNAEGLPFYRCTVCGHESFEAPTAPPPMNSGSASETKSTDGKANGCSAVTSTAEALLTAIIAVSAAFILKKRTV
ncbi:MAG: hypothetical protein IKC26_07675 [Clostridia bacterium]|nr:hypothetical protein [Clostridia bacterium]